MKCQNCGKELNQDMQFCNNCGAPVMQLPQPPMQNNQPVQFQQNPIPPQMPVIKKKKPLYKKWWFWVLMGLATFFVYIIGVAAIGSSDSEDTTSTTSAVAVETTAEVDAEEATTEKPTEQPATEKSKENLNKVIFNNNGVKITYTGTEEGLLGTNINLLIENNSGQDYTIQARDVSVDGYMIEPIFSCEVKSGKKANTSLEFFEDDLNENGIENIETIELYFTVFNWDDDSNDFDTEMITIEP